MLNLKRRLLKPLKKRRRNKRRGESKVSRQGIFVSYPKSGRTWLRVMLGELGLILKYSHNGMGLSKARPLDSPNLCSGSTSQRYPTVFLARDPRDTVVSAYFSTKLRMAGGYEGEISDFIRDPLFGVEKIVRYNLTWLESGPRLPAFLPITYEETSADAFAVVRKIIDFLGVEVPDAEIERVVADNTFEKMRERERSGAYAKTYPSALPQVRDANRF